MGAIYRVALRWVTRGRLHHLAINDEIRRERARVEIDAITIGAVHEMAQVLQSSRCVGSNGGEAVIEGDAVEIEER